jgi:GTP-binding protein Era
MSKFKSGFVTVIGRPNVGKSTLINALVGQKVAIMSDKPQTTRNKIHAVYNENDLQVVFLDTPGLHKPKNKLGEYMVKTALDTLGEVDLIFFMVDESPKIGPGDAYIMEQLRQVKTKKVLIINKVDLLSPENHIKLVESYKEMDLFDDILSVSALKGTNFPFIKQILRETMPEGPQYYPDGMVSDQPERAIVGEIIREKLLHYLDQEVPHGIAVLVDRIEKREDQEILDIEATIICERESHKGIIIGKGGRKLKGVGKSARQEMEVLLGSKVYLDIWVKVKPKWRNDASSLKNYGYR